MSRTLHARGVRQQCGQKLALPTDCVGSIPCSRHHVAFRWRESPRGASVIFTKRLAQLIGPAFCITALLLFSFAAHAQPAKAGKGREIAGSVSDVDGNPIAGATVTVGDGGPSATTAADGS